MLMPVATWCNVWRPKSRYFKLAMSAIFLDSPSNLNIMTSIMSSTWIALQEMYINQNLGTGYLTQIIFYDIEISINLK